MTGENKMRNYIGIEDRDKLIEFINSCGIKSELINFDEYGFSRTIELINGSDKHYIIWFKNDSTLYLGKPKESPLIPFRYVYLDHCYPLTYKYNNRSLGFSYDINKTPEELSMPRLFPYGILRIPISPDNKIEREIR